MTTRMPSSCAVVFSRGLVLITALGLAGCGDGPTEPDPRGFLVNGFAAIERPSATIEGIAVHETGEMVAVFRDVSEGRIASALYRSATGKTFTTFLGPDRLPRTAVSEGFVFVYENWTPTSVDIAIIDPGGSITIERNVAVDASEFFVLASSDEGWYAAPYVDGGAILSLGDVLRVGALTLKAAGCGAAIIKTVGVASPCLKLVLGSILATSAIDDERIRLSVKGFSWAAGTLGCVFEWDVLECVTLATDIAATSVEQAEKTFAQWEQTVREARSFLLAPTIWNGQSELVAANAAGCPTDPNTGEIASRFRQSFEYADPDGDVTEVGARLRVAWTSVPAGSGRDTTYHFDLADDNPRRLGDGFSGIIELPWCAHFGVSITRWDGAYILTDAAGNPSNALTIPLERPVTAGYPAAQGEESVEQSQPVVSPGPPLSVPG
jgi:hypothetical protein